MMKKHKESRPHLWKVKGEIPHQQYCAWQKMKAQADFRGEPWELTFEQYQEIWGDFWQYKGRGTDDYCLTRYDLTEGWYKDNVKCVQRIQHLREHKQRQREGFYHGKNHKISTKAHRRTDSVS
jgi:hypothetical protein